MEAAIFSRLLLGGNNMKYFKIIKDNTIIGAVTSQSFVRYQPETGSFTRATEENGEYLAYNGYFYRATWMVPMIKTISHIDALILAISEEEYNIYMDAISNHEQLPDEEVIPIEPDEPTPVDPIEQLSIDFIRSSKLKELSIACRRAIENGIDLTIRGETKHFSLTAQDQLNLMDLKTLVETEDFIPYHADNEEQMFYTAAEIKQIIAAASAHKIYQTTYHNSLKTYVNSLETIEEISAITYGISIPEEYKTEVLKTLKTE